MPVESSSTVMEMPDHHPVISDKRRQGAKMPASSDVVDRDSGAAGVVEGAHGLGPRDCQHMMASGARVLDAQADRHQGL
jgi:hypothetical protein